MADEFDSLAGKTRDFFRVVRSFMKTKLIPALYDILHITDKRAEQKVGFIAAPLIPAMGGIGTWLVSRGIAVLIALAVSGVYISHIKSGATEAERARLMKIMEDEKSAAERKLAKRERELKEQLATLDGEAKKVQQTTNEAIIRLNAELEGMKTNPVAWTLPVTAAIRAQAAAANSGKAEAPTKKRRIK